MNTITFYAIQLVIPEPASSNRQEKKQLFLGANGVLTGVSNLAQLESEELAQQFMEACLPRLVRKHGDGVKVEVVTCKVLSKRENNRLAARITTDSALAKKRLETCGGGRVSC